VRCLSCGLDADRLGTCAVLIDATDLGGVDLGVYAICRDCAGAAAVNGPVEVVLERGCY